MVLRVDGLSKKFSGKAVIKNINIELNKGEILAIIGPSGAGKTTLLRCINALEYADRGSIEIEGRFLCKDENSKSTYASKNELRSIRKNIGMVFQNYNLFPHMTILENIIQSPMKVFGESKEIAQENAIIILKSLGLEEKINAYPFELSGGQKQRAAIARACALNPKIMCFDEPTSALDPELTLGVASIIKELSNKGMGILIITHDMDFARKVAHKVIFMENGEIIDEGPNEKIFNNPLNNRIKEFVFNK